MNDKELKKLKSIFKNFPEIKLVYFFGSKAKDKGLKDIENFLAEIAKV